MSEPQKRNEKPRPEKPRSPAPEPAAAPPSAAQPAETPVAKYVFKIAPADPKNAFDFEDVADK